MTPAADTIDAPAWVDSTYAAERAGVTTRTWDRWVANGTVPDEIVAPATLGNSRDRRYIRKKLDAFLDGDL